METTLKSERELHHYKIVLEQASSAKALIMVVQIEKDAVAEAKVCLMFNNCLINSFVIINLLLDFKALL